MYTSPDTIWDFFHFSFIQKCLFIDNYIFFWVLFYWIKTSLPLYLKLYVFSILFHVLFVSHAKYLHPTINNIFLVHFCIFFLVCSSPSPHTHYHINLISSGFLLNLFNIVSPALDLCLKYIWRLQCTDEETAEQKE